MRTILFMISCIITLTSLGNSNSFRKNFYNQTSLISSGTPTVKVVVFNDVKKTIKTLSQNGIGQLNNWRGDELGFMSSSDYFSFGSKSSINGMQNNIAYYLDSENSNYIKTLSIILNINNANQSTQSLLKFKEIVEKTFKSLELKIPEGLTIAISKPKEFKVENEKFKTYLGVCRTF